MRVLLVHCDHRPFEVERFGAAWVRAGGEAGELVAVTPATAARVLPGIDGEVDGLLLTGGPDVEPWRYGRTNEPGVEQHPDAARDALDLELLARGDEERWPVLGVCYGAQVLAVSRGGTLIQDLARTGKPGHQVGPRDRLAHLAVRTATNGALDRLPQQLLVNSRHHQAVETPGATLQVAARAGDGVIEAVQGTEAGRWVVGVQWHPEDLAAEPHVDLFRIFRAACGSRRAAGAPPARVG